MPRARRRPGGARTARRSRAALAGAVLAGALAACSDPQPIRIGLLAGLTGRNYDLGISCRNGASLAVEEINEAGGIGGRKIELLVRDDAQDPATARRMAEELIRDGVIAIVGPATSSVAAEVLPVANREHVLLVSPTVSSSRFQGQDDWLVMLHPSTAVSARAMSSHAVGRGLRRAVLFQDGSNEVFTEAWSEAFVGDFQGRGGKVLRRVPFVSGKVKAYSALVREGLAARPDVAVIVASALDTAAIAQQIRKASTIQIIGTEWSFTNDLVTHGGSAVEGGLFPVKVNLQDVSPRFLRLRQAYEKRFSERMDFAAVLSYDAVEIVAAGLRRDATREGLRKAILEQGVFTGAQGEIPLDAYGDSQLQQRVATVRDGKPRILE